MTRRQRFTRNMGRTPSEAMPKRGTGNMFVRFAHAREPYGVFSYLDEARRCLGESDRQELEGIVIWFREHLEAPDSLVPVRSRPESNATAVCWFRSVAREHVRKARRLAVLIRRARIPIVEWRRDAVPGEICSEDAHQIATAAFWRT